MPEAGYKQMEDLQTLINKPEASGSVFEVCIGLLDKAPTAYRGTRFLMDLQLQMPYNSLSGGCHSAGSQLIHGIIAPALWDFFWCLNENGFIKPIVVNLLREYRKLVIDREIEERGELIRRGKQADDFPDWFETQQGPVRSVFPKGYILGELVHIAQDNLIRLRSQIAHPHPTSMRDTSPEVEMSRADELIYGFFTARVIVQSLFALRLCL